MKDGRMIPTKENWETKVEKDWENIIIVVIRAVNARVHGATRRLKGLFGSTVILWFAIEQLENAKMTLEGNVTDGWDADKWCVSVFVAPAWLTQHGPLLAMVPPDLTWNLHSWTT